jgi:hypothetical protein
MTPGLEALGRRAVACKGWRWMPGMRLWCLTRGYGRIISLIGDRLLIEWERGHHRKTWTPKQANSQLLPDLSDPATLGCLLALVREAWDDDRVSSVANTVYGTRMILMPDDAAPEGERLIGCSTTEAEALIEALKAAP